MENYELYTKDYIKKTIKINHTDIKKIFSLSNEKLDLLIKEENINEYLYVLSLYVIQNKMLYPLYLDKAIYIKDKLFYIQKIDEIVRNNISEKEKLANDKHPNYKYDYKIDTELLEYILSGINKNYGSFQKIIYYYFVCCNIFNTDSKLNYLSQINPYLAGKYRLSFDNLYKINLDNNDVTCFEIVEIIKALAKNEGMIVLDDNISNYGTRRHVTFEGVLDKTYIKLDPLNNVKPYNDMIGVKKNMPYNGIYVKKEQTLDSVIQNVYEDVQKRFLKTDNKRFTNKNINDVLTDINRINIDKDVKKSIKDIILMINNFKTKKIEYYTEIIRNKQSIFNKTNGNVNVSVVLINDDKYTFSAILSTNSNFYIKIDEDKISLTNKEELIKQIENDSIIITRNRSSNKEEMYNFIDGIDRNIQVKNNLRACNNLFPKLLKNINGINDSNLKYNI